MQQSTFVALLCRAATGRPTLRFDGHAKQHLAAAGVTRAHVSISHDTDYATAFVVLEAEEGICGIADDSSNGGMGEA